MDAAADVARTTTAPEDDGAALEAEPLGAGCSIDDFAKLDLRVARVIAAKPVPDAKKLLELTLSLGGAPRARCSPASRPAYDPEKLVGRLVVMVANLAPRKMKFGVSEGMVVAAGPGEKDVFLLSPERGRQARTTRALVVSPCACRRFVTGDSARTHFAPAARKSSGHSFFTSAAEECLLEL